MMEVMGLEPFQIPVGHTLAIKLSQDGNLCLGIPPKIKECYSSGFNLLRLIHHIQEYLYWVSYVEKYGNEPWEPYAHGKIGYAQLCYEEIKKMQRKK